MLSFPRRRRGKDNRQLYSISNITSFILVCQRDNHIFYSADGHMWAEIYSYEGNMLSSISTTAIIAAAKNDVTIS